MKAIACVVLMIGMLNFAQQAPELFKKLFSFGGDLLKGVNLNPKGQLKNDLKPAIGAVQKVGSTVAGGLGGFAAGAARGARNARADYEANGGTSKVGGGVHTAFASVGGGVRGLVRGSKNGFQNSSGNMHEQLMHGADQGNIAAQINSQNYRDGKSAHLIGRLYNRTTDGVVKFGTEHIKEPAVELMNNITGKTTSNEAAQMFAQTKANNTAAMTATGTDNAIKDLKDAKTSALSKVREAKAMGTDINELKNELHITDPAITDYKGLEDAIKSNFESQKKSTLDAKFGKMNDENKKIIAEYNKQSVDNFEKNISLLGQDDLKDLLKNIKVTDSSGAAFKADISSSTEVQKSLDKLVSILRESTTSSSLDGTNGGRLMMNMEALQTQLKSTNDTIENRKALEQHNREARQKPTQANKGGDSSKGGAS